MSKFTMQSGVMDNIGEKLVRTTSVKVGIIGVIGGIIGLLLLGTLFMPSQSAPYAAAYGSTAFPTNLNGIANSCSATLRWTPSTKYYGIIPDSFYNRYKSVKDLPVPQTIMAVPVYGYLDRDVLPKNAIKFYSTQDDPKYTPWTVMRVMYEYDTTVIWYIPTTDPDSINAIKHYADTHANVLALPWTYSDQIERGTNYAIASWGTMQLCQNYSADVITDFRAFIKTHRVPRAEPAPIAKMSKYGILNSLTPNGDGE